jgi:hypothetical protein
MADLLSRGLCSGVFMLLALASQAVPALADNPSLSIYDGEDANGREKTRYLAIERLNLSIRLDGDIATTVAIVTFTKSDSRTEEGELLFELPEGAAVNDYALDVNGRMISGVLGDTRRTKLRYEATVRRGVDPGLAEVTADNVFRTRVFPLRGSRTVRLSFVTPVDDAAPFRLPFSTQLPVGAMHVTVTATGTAKRPDLVAPGGMRLEWQDRNGLWEAQGSVLNQPLSGALLLGPVLPEQPLHASRHSNGEAFFEINDAMPMARAAGAGRLRIYWDNSRSRGRDNRANEIELLRRYIAQVRPRQVDVVLFSDAASIRTLVSPSPQAVAALLQNTSYRGATSWQVASRIRVPPADVCLLFSDAIFTIDSHGVTAMPCQLFAISQARDANRGFLNALSRGTGGEFLDLRVVGLSDALARLQRRVPSVTSVTDAAGRPLAYAVLPVSGSRIRLVGRLPDAGGIVVKTTLGERRYAAASPVAAGDGPGAIWAARRLEEMNASDRPDRAALLALARRFNVAGVGVSFVVFENAEDYASVELEPPAEWDETFRQTYRKIVADEARDRQREADNRLQDILRSWATRKQWWSTKFEYKPRPASAPPPPRPSGGGDFGGGGFGIEAVQSSVSRIPDITVEIAPWNPDRPYLTALRNATARNFRTTLAAQEAEHGVSAAFYLDVAEFLFRQGRRAEAVRMLLSALDFPFTGTATLSIVADRLMLYGERRRAFWLYERVLFLEPDRPQPWRDLALALADRAENGQGRAPAAVRADYVRAMDLLRHVVMTPWSGSYDGIEMVALMEANRLVPRLRALGRRNFGFDPRLIALLDVDLRILLEWNTDETDMDLWVTEPTGEKAIYSNPRTGLGGSLSNDMTQGYGPEEYLLRAARSGEYVVEVNVYATDRLNPNGKTRVRATVFQNYGRANEQRQHLELELGQNDKDALLIGKISVKAPGRTTKQKP